MNLDNLPDKELFRLCAEGNREAWDFLVDKYSKLIYNAIYTTMRMYSSAFQREDVEDIFSQVFVALLDDNYRRLGQFRGDRHSSAATWLSVIAMNTTRNHLSRTKIHLSLDDESTTGEAIRSQTKSPQPSAYEQLSDAQEHRVLELLIEKLKPQEKLILKYHREGLSSKEIGAIVGKTQNAIDSLLSRIRNKLKEILDSL
jgi:RNA polymerase sigma factor (sigma-70 family)